MVGDEMFATERDSVHLGRRSTATRENGRVGVPSPTVGAGGIGGVAGPADDVTVDVLRRLRERVDRNVRLVDRMRADPLAPEPPGLTELIDTARRMRHDAEALLLLSGLDAGARPGAPVRLSALLDEAVDATEEPMRVDVRSGPTATVEPSAATELLHVVAEVVDHVTAIHPGGRVEVSSRADAPGGIVIEIRTASTTRYDPGGRRGMAAAARIAQRSRSGLVLRTPPTGPAGSGAPVVTIHCPARAVSIQELDYIPASPLGHDEPWPGSRPAAAHDPHVGASGSGTNGRSYADPILSGPTVPGALFDEAETPPQGLPLAPVSPFAPPPSPSPRPARARTSVDSLFGELEIPAVDPFEADGRRERYAESRYEDSGYADTGYGDTGHVDELFGPLVDLPAEPDDPTMTTPIFEAVASAWFREDGSEEQGEAADWESPGDREWRAAAERAARPDTTSYTSGGLPRRQPGGRLVPPPVRDVERGDAAGHGGGHARPADRVPDRVPDRVRERLATYQRGLREGRHRAEPADPGDPAAW